MFENKSAKEQGIDTTKGFRCMKDYNNYADIGDILELSYDDGSEYPYFRNITQPDKGYGDIRWSGLAFPFYWHCLEYTEPVTLPEYILCSTPELAKLVLEKIERDWPDKRWSRDKKPTGFIPNEYYPELVIDTKEIMEYGDIGSFQSEGITNFTKAEDYLGIEKVTTGYSYIACDNTIESPSYSITTTNKITPTGRTLMSKIIEFAKNLTLSADDKLLKKYGLVNDFGNETAEYQTIVMDKIMKENKAYVVGIAEQMEEEEKK